MRSHTAIPTLIKFVLKGIPFTSYRADRALYRRNRALELVIP